MVSITSLADQVQDRQRASSRCSSAHAPTEPSAPAGQAGGARMRACARSARGDGAPTGQDNGATGHGCEHVSMAERESLPSEVERQLTAAAERHRELIAAGAVAAPPEQGPHAAAAALARGVQLVSFTLARAAAAGIPRERLVELSGWDASVIEDLLAN